MDDDEDASGEMSYYLMSKPCSTKLAKLENLNPNIIKMKYAIFGPVVIRSLEIEMELREGMRKPFEEVTRANIGDCHAMHQLPMTFVRQLMVVSLQPDLLESCSYPDDVKDRVRSILKDCRGGSIGAYTDSVGVKAIRQQVAQYLTERDGGIPSDCDNIILTSGSTAGIKEGLLLFASYIDNKPTGIMVPIPLYPCYSAVIEQYGLYQVTYYLNEEFNWNLEIKELKRAYDESKRHCVPRALVVINPGNPTGQVLKRRNIERLIEFAYQRQLVIIADEVYQYTVYDDDSQFYSFKRVLFEMGDPFNRMELISLNSISKGYIGECGIRGGYMEFVNICPRVMGAFKKSVSLSLCPNTLGQVAVIALVNPPRKGEPSYELYEKEKQITLRSLKQRAEMAYEYFENCEGFSMTIIQGALYAFPKLDVPPKALEAAKEKKMDLDEFYCFELLESTGICVIPGSGFGQKEGTYHFRTTILPQMAELQYMVKRLKNFHSDFIKKYRVSTNV